MSRIAELKQIYRNSFEDEARKRDELRRGLISERDAQEWIGFYQRIREDARSELLEHRTGRNFVYEEGPRIQREIKEQEQERKAQEREEREIRERTERMKQERAEREAEDERQGRKFW